MKIMMKGFFLFKALVLMLFSISPLHGNDVLVEAKAALFRPSSNKFRDIYSTNGMYGDEISCQVWRHIYLFGSVSVFHASGESIWSNNNTEITIIPIAFGLKQFFTIHCVDLYVGVAPVATHMRTNDHSPYVIQNSSKWKIGGIGKIGAILNINRRTFLDLFSDYSFVKLDFHGTDGGRVTRQQADLSGWSVGVGLGFRL